MGNVWDDILLTSHLEKTKIIKMYEILVKEKLIRQTFEYLCPNENPL